MRNKEYLITSEKRRDKPWPNDYIDETFYMKSKDIDWNLEHLLLGVGTLMKSNQGDAIAALDDYDIKKAMYLRKNVRIDGDGIQTAWRYCRDKLAIHMRAKSSGISIRALVLCLTIKTSILSLLTCLLHGF